MVKGKMVAMVFLDPYSIKEQLGDHADIDIMFCIDCVKLAIDDYKEKLSKQAKQNKTVEEKPEVVEESEVVEETLPFSFEILVIGELIDHELKLYQ